VEMLGVAVFSGIYRGKRTLITGHTGFKGSWLSLWLTELGADVTGVSLSPETSPNHWDLLGLPMKDCRLDIRDSDAVQRVFLEVQPEMVFHLAAQPLVRRSYRDPLQTWSTNVMGTASVLEACRLQPSVTAVVVVTTDKCYENREWPWGYRENDPLGGHDPYSASKAATELVAASYRDAFFMSNSNFMSNSKMAPLLATARAGNVIGGGDWSQDRLIPDAVRALEKNVSLEIRSPQATRPWQHVLESLSGYLFLGQKLLMGDKCFAEAWNFGPSVDGNRTVAEVLMKLQQYWKTMRWHVTEQQQLHEANLLYLDSAKANTQLGWSPVWNLETTLQKTAEWYSAWQTERVISQQQLAEYMRTAIENNLQWAQ